MRIEGWLLDVRLIEDEASLWVKTSKGREELRCKYYPSFYVLPTLVSFTEFLDLFDEHPNIPLIEKTERYFSISDQEYKPVLKVSVDSTQHYRSVLKLVEKYGEVFDSELSHTQRFLADFNLIPLGEVITEVDERSYVKSLNGVPLDLRVEPPPFKLLCFELYQDGEILSFLTYADTMHEEYNFRGEEGETLKSFMDYIEDSDPDLISCLESDMKIFLTLCKKHRHPLFGVFHKKRFHLTSGRVYLSLHIYRRTSLAGVIERIMYTREVPRIGSDYAAGRAIESRQSYEARRKGYLLPKRGFYQPVMSLQELLCKRDHGGLIFSPNVGLHENVAALDFESMFPHLILKENISYENVKTMRESEGFLLDFTRDTLERRLFFKHHKKELEEKPEEWFWCETRQQALKEILFCTYGYSGCWANKFGNMDTFMEINKAARKNLVDAMNISRRQGFHTLYGNCDSLFLEKKGATRVDFDSLAALIMNKLNLPITLENHFKYLVLLPQKSEKGFGAINRYYGLRYDGQLVSRGIELRRRNTPIFIADIQRKAIERLLDHKSREAVLTKGIQDVQKLVTKATRLLKQGQVPIKELEAKTILRRKPSKYKARLPHVTAAEALDINKTKVERGSVIRYVYVDSDHDNPFRRVSPAGFQKKYDSKKYIRLLEEAMKSILLPFIDDEDMVSTVVSLDSFF
jgi:DNA polymerase elongation subunit (family B)